MQKISVTTGSSSLNPRTEFADNRGVQTFIWIAENNLTEVQLTGSGLLERVLSPFNLNQAYKRVVSNGGSSGVDNMKVEDLLLYLRSHGDELVSSLLAGTYRPSAVRRVEIPKGNGKTRILGIPTVIDRFIQQAICQVLSPMYEPLFDEHSYGFRPNRGSHMALREVRDHVQSRYQYGVDLDLERFFDTVNHGKMIELLSRHVKDGRLISLVHKYLRAGFVSGGIYHAASEGMPQGGPLSPLLSNVLLDMLDKELASRGHRFVRYADDCLILCKSKRAAERVKVSITRFIEERLKLKVNRHKTVVGHIRSLKYLGYSFYFSRGKCRFRVHGDSYTKLKTRLREITSRSNGMSLDKRKHELTLFIKGWLEYFKLADMSSHLSELDSWLRHRIRACIWKQWKMAKTRFKNLLRCGLREEDAYKCAHTSKGYWQATSGSLVQRAMSDERLRRTGYPTFKECLSKIAS